MDTLKTTDGAELRLDNEFVGWVASLKNEIRNAQIKAAVKVNTELLRLYWHLGAEICEKQKNAKWGDGWLEELSRELTKEFPKIKGLSYRNLRYVRQWYLFYNQDDIIWQQVVAKFQEVFFFRAMGTSSIYYFTLRQRSESSLLSPENRRERLEPGGRCR